MKEETATVLQPDVYGKFHCLADQCKVSCCIGWRVTIDRETYQKYKGIQPDQPLYGQIQSGIKKQRKNASKHLAAAMVLDKNSRCPFLAESGLCHLQSEYGEGYLCDTCKYYPRITYWVDGVIHRGLDVSCEAAAQLLLLQPEGIGFEQVSERAPKLSEERYGLQLRTDLSFHQDSAKRYFIPLRTFSIDLLQNRSFPLSERMLILGMAMKDVQQCIDEKRTEDIPAVIQKYGGGALPREALAAQLNRVPYRADIRAHACHGVVSAACLLTTIHKKQSLKDKLLTFVNTGLLTDITDTRSVAPENFEQAIQAFEEKFQKIYLPFEESYGYIMENLMVNYVFNNYFPCEKDDHLYETYLNLLFTYLLNQVALVSYGITTGKLDAETALLAIGFVSRNFHHSVFFKKAAELCQKRYQLDNMAHIAAVLKEPTV